MRPENWTERRIFDGATRNVMPEGPAELMGMPRHVYVPNSYPLHETGDNCWFVWREDDGPGVSRCRSTLGHHKKLGWVEIDPTVVVASDGFVR